MTAAERARRTEDADRLARHAYAVAGAPAVGATLVAVGGYGRSELAPHSDLDLVLVSDQVGEEWSEVAARVWYPLWDAGVRLDHAVRTLEEMQAAAAGDVRVAAGLLDVRHVAGDPDLALRLRASVLTQWRRQARVRLPELGASVRARHARVGELAHLSLPDLKASVGGLRDATVLKALTATWLVDVPAVDLERSRQQLLDVRDVLHAVAGRPTDRVAPEHWEGLALGLGLPDEAAAQRHVRLIGRRIAHLSRLAWRRADDAMRPGRSAGQRRPELRRVAPGVALSKGEVVLDRGARPDRDATLLLRAAAEAATRDAVLSPPSAARLVREGAPLPDPWPAEARRQLVRLLAAGPGLRGVWETWEETGALERVLPEWEHIRLLPHASPIHRFTVDRHVVETCVEAAALIRTVARPDLLLVAALLHDIGKGGQLPHSLAGEPIARRIARRMGFDDADADLIAVLVRHHLLLVDTATTRDPHDPATIATVAGPLPDPEALDLLLALTEADARAASAKAWSTWRAGLVHRLATPVRAYLATGTAARAPEADARTIPPAARDGGLAVEIVESDDGARITTIAPDRVGLLADVAAVLALRRVGVRAARVWAQEEYGLAVWDVVEPRVSAGALRDAYDAVTGGRIDVAARLAARAPATGELEPAVVVHPEASAQATVLEVRAADQLGIIHQVAAALAELEMTVRSAHITTLGPQATDVFYVQETGGVALSETRAADAAHAVRAAISPLKPRPGDAS